MMCYAWKPNPSYSTSPPCGNEVTSGGESGLFGLSWTTIALLAGGAFLLLRKKR